MLQYDKDKNHVLSRAELLHLVRAGIDNATDREVEWFLGMIGILQYPCYIPSLFYMYKI